MESPPTRKRSRFDGSAAKLFKTAKNTYGYLQRTLLRDGSALPPASLFVIITTRCNLACDMCFLIHQGSLNTGKQQELTLDEIKGIVEQTPSETVVTYTGGEPFARRDFLELARWTAARRRFHVISNGSLMRPEMAEKLIDLAPASARGKGFVAMGLSILGDEETHDRITNIRGSFAKACRSLTLLREERDRRGLPFPHLDMKLVLTEQSTPGLTKLLPVVEAVQPDSVTLQLEASIHYAWYEQHQGPHTEGPVPPSRTMAFPPPTPGLDKRTVTVSLEEFRRLWAERSAPSLFLYPGTAPELIPDHVDGEVPVGNAACYSPWTDVFVGPWGDVGTCLFGTVGNIREHSLAALRNHPKFREFRKLMREHKILPACRGCCFWQDGV